VNRQTIVMIALWVYEGLLKLFTLNTWLFKLG